MMRACSEDDARDSVWTSEQANVTSIADLPRYQDPNPLLSDDLASAESIIITAMLCALIWAVLGMLVWLFW